VANARDNSDAPGRGDKRFTALVTRFRDPLMLYFQRRVTSPEDAEELVQEVFIRIFRRPDFDRIDNLEAFVFITAANILKDHYRYKSRHGGSGGRPLDGVIVASNEPNPSQVVEDRDDIGVLMRAIGELPPKCRAVFVLFRFEEVPQAEIARRLGITVSMVEKHIAAALIDLKKRLRAAHNENGRAHD
jgi:RNA polymerase sigma factor (sigma-70 family)